MSQVDIRMTTPEDYYGVMALLLEFKDEILSEYGLDLNVPAYKEVMKEYVNSSFVAIKDGQMIGIIAGKFASVPMITEKFYQEQVWFVKKEYRSVGLRLMAELTKWCKEQGTKFIITSRVSNFKPEKFDALYRRIGFVPYEVHYIKTI